MTSENISECLSFQLHYLVFTTDWNHSQYQYQRHCIYAKVVVPCRADSYTGFVCIAYMLSWISTFVNSNQSWKLNKLSMLLTWIITYTTQPGSLCSTLEQAHLTPSLVRKPPPIISNGCKIFGNSAPCPGRVPMKIRWQKHMLFAAATWYCDSKHTMARHQQQVMIS